MRCRKNIGRVLAGILVVGLLVSSMPSVAYATENESGIAVVAEQEEPVSEENRDESGQESAETEPAGKEAGKENAAQPEEGKESAKPEQGEGDDESGEEIADLTDTTPEEEDEGKQEDTVDSEQTDEDEEDGAGNAVDAEEPEMAGEAEKNLTDEVQIDEDKAEAELCVQLASDDIASGSYKNITWVIDASGKLTVAGNGNANDSGYVPWYEYRQLIKSAEVRVTGMTSAHGMFAGCSNLTALDLSNFDTSTVTRMSDMFSYCSNLSSLDLSSINTAKVTDMSYMFRGCSNLSSLNLSSFNTAKVTDMSNMFRGCSNLGSLDLSSFNTANVTAMTYMFYGCRNLGSLDLSNFNTSKVTTMDFMFEYCSNLSSLDLSSFNTSNVTYMQDMFYDCSNLISLDVSGFNTANVTDMGAMFSGCSNLTSLDLRSFNTINVTSMGSMFDGCSSLSSLDLGSFNTEKVTDMDDMFHGCSNLGNLDLSGFNTTNVTDMRDMFSGCSNLSRLDVSRFNTANVTNMSGMFNGCSNLSSLDVSRFNTANVTDMGWMFDGCSNLSSLDVSNFNTSKVTYMGLMFLGCSNLSSLDVSGFSTKNVTDMHSMFLRCSNLSGLDVSGFNTANVTDMGAMFSNCSNLSSLDVSRFNTTNVTSMGSMFSGCSNLSSLDVSSFNTTGVINMESMFSGCSNLGSLDLNSFNTSKITDMRYMFYGCSSLSSLGLSSFNTSKVTNMRDMFTLCGNLSSLNLSSFNISNVTTKWDMLEIWDMFSLSTIYAPCGLKVSVSLPTYWESGFKEEWRLPNGTVVTELPRNLTRSVKLQKYRIPEQSPDEGSSDDQLKYVQKLTQASLKNADAESKESIQNAIYNLLFKAEYRPTESRIPDDNMTYTGSRDVIARWPIQNKDYRTPIFWSNKVTDAQLGTITYNISSAGCMSYACFATTYVYGTSGNGMLIKNPDAETVRDFIRSYADPGEQLRYGMPHSIVFLGEDADGDGFYYINYDGGDDGAGHLYHDLYVSSYARYADFAAVIASYEDKRFYIYDANNGSYYNNTAASAADVRNGRGAVRIVTRLACPIEATIELNGEILDSRNPGAASFGTVVRDGEEVVFTLNYSPDYRLTVNGTGEGGMTLTLEYYGEGETLIDRRKFVDMPIKDETEIESSGFDPQASFVLYKSDNTGETEAWGAGIGETVYGANNLYRGDNASMPENTPIITFDANGGTIGDEVVAFIATNEDGMIAVLPEAVRDGYVFKGWYTSRMHGIKVDETRIYMENTTLYAQWEKTGGNTPGDNDPGGNTPGDNDPGDDTPGSDIPAEDIPESGIPEGLWIAGVKDSYTYTGTAIKPEIRVYDGKTRLQPGKDYTASYKNNTKVSNEAQSFTAPTITVKGKGNYAGSETATFQITAVDLSDSVVLTEDITAAYNKKIQKKVPIVTYNGKKLSANRDFTVSYPNGGDGAYKEVGVYDILLTAKSGGNFTGTRTVKCTITDNTLLSKVSVKKIPAQVYTGEAIEPELTVSFKGAPLAKDTDYSVSFSDNTEIGTAKAILTGIGKYAGTKIVTFSITGTSLKGASVSGIENKIYNGCDQKQTFTVTLNGKVLAEGTDYDVLYEKNKNTGKASVTIKGKGAYTGTVRKTFAVEKFNIAANADGRFEVKLEQDVVPYAKGGAKPEVTVRFKTGDEKWETLAEGKDYTLSYRNHTAVNDGGNQNKQPVVTVKGKGNFSGTYGTALPYKIVAQDLGQLRLTAQDKTYQNKKNVYATKITITDLDGKVLKPGTDYDKALTYSYANETTVHTSGHGTIVRAAGDFVDKNDVIPAGTVLKVQAEAGSGGNYAGTLSGEYRIVQASVSSASVSVPKQIYTGRAITLEKNRITVRIKGKQLDESQYEIVPDSYNNNVKKGTATVTIRGVDNYGGTKDVKFTIKAKGFLWWWR